MDFEEFLLCSMMSFKRPAASSSRRRSRGKVKRGTGFNGEALGSLIFVLMNCTMSRICGAEEGLSDVAPKL